jgi:hypothetical protein
MLMKMSLGVAICGMSLLGTSAFAEVNMHEGLWEITTKTEMPGMPIQMPARKHRQCLTKNKMEPKTQDQEAGCKLTDRKISGNTLTWVIKCSGENAMQAVGKITYYGDSFKGTITMKASDGEEGEMNIVNRLSGIRIGECK